MWIVIHNTRQSVTVLVKPPVVFIGLAGGVIYVRNCRSRGRFYWIVCTVQKRYVFLCASTYPMLLGLFVTSYLGWSNSISHLLMQQSGSSENEAFGEANLLCKFI